jgi:hypothetical protein
VTRSETETKRERERERETKRSPVLRRPTGAAAVGGCSSVIREDEKKEKKIIP